MWSSGAGGVLAAADRRARLRAVGDLVDRAPAPCCRSWPSAPAGWVPRSASPRSSSASRRCPSSPPPSRPACSSSGSASAAPSCSPAALDAVGVRARARRALAVGAGASPCCLMGPTGAVFLLARQSYLTAAAPVALRARAMSTLGGVTRIGLFVGPLVGAPVVARWGPQAAFGVAVVAGLLAAALAVAHRRPRGAPRRRRPSDERACRSRRVVAAEPPGAAHRGAGRAGHRAGPVLAGGRRAAVGRARRPRRRADLARLRRRRLRRGGALLAGRHRHGPARPGLGRRAGRPCCSASGCSPCR